MESGENKLLPVVISSKRRADSTRVGGLIAYKALCAYDNKIITTSEDVPGEWLTYMKDALNNYPVTRILSDGTPDVNKYELLNVITIPGEPLPNRPETLLKNLRRTKSSLFVKKAKLPITQRIWVSCLFYMQQSKEQYSLHELISGTIEDMISIGVFPDVDISNIFCVDGSKILYTEKESCTKLCIRGINR